MRLKPSKCEFHQTETEYLEFISSQNGIKVDSIKTKAIQTWAKPTRRKAIQSFLGFCNFYQRFIEGFIRIANPPYQLTEKEKKWEFGEKQQNAFENLVHKLTYPLILAHYDTKKAVTMETDASKYVTAGIISQIENNGFLRPIAFRSKSMSKSECNYNVHNKKLLAIILALEDWRSYVKGSGQQAKILTHHKNQVPFMSKKRLNERQVRWKLFLSQFDLKIEYRPGTEGSKPDALTRVPGYLPTQDDQRNTQMEQIIPPQHYFEDTKVESIELLSMYNKNEDQIRRAYQKDAELKKIQNALERGKKEMKGMALGLCQWKDGHLWYREKIWIPEKEGLRTTIISQCHDNSLAGRGGIAKTTELVSRQYYWPKMRQTIKRYIKNCDACQSSKVVRHAPYGLLQPNEVPDQPWRSLAMDLIPDLPGSDRYDTILVVIDRLTKMSHFISCKKNLDTQQFATLFMQHVVRLDRIPRDIVTNRGSLFTSRLWKQITEKSGIERRLSTAFHPQTDGQTQRTNAILEQYLRAYVNYQQDNWNELLPQAEFAYNNRYQETIKIT